MGMEILHKISIANLKKTIRYCRKNGFSKMIYAIAERLHKSQLDEYTPKVPSETELEEQRTYAWKHHIKISIIVPAYETKKEYLKQMIDSVIAQTYYDWELIIADASSSNQVMETVREYEDVRIVYKRLNGNEGISENSNKALQFATGEYIALLDHDDIITPATLYEVARKLEGEIEDESLEAEEPILIYTDEDKMDEARNRYYEPNYKREFNLDLILSNNYMCHFTTIRADYMKELGFRKEYDGAQDYDLFLRIVARLWKEHKLNRIEHIDKVLYHWRCHKGSTSENPESKMYAYEAGRKALQDFTDGQGWDAMVTHTSHLGYYRINYIDNNMLTVREDVGAIGGNVVQRNKICGGAMFLDGTVLYKDLSIHYSGYMHLAAMVQDADAVDIRCMRLQNHLDNPEIYEYYRTCKEKLDTATEDEIIKMSLQLCKMIRTAGLRVVFDPQFVRNL